MSKLRPELVARETNNYCPRGAAAYYEVLAAVEQQDGLLHRKLDGPFGEHCALGSYYAIHKDQSFPTEILDEIASVNDSVPKLTKRARLEYVKRYLKWKLRTYFGFTYRTPKPTQKAAKAAARGR